MAKFKVGDKVKVVNNGSRYDTFIGWFEAHREYLKTEWLVEYRYNDDDIITGDICTVLYCAPHTMNTSNMLYLIEHSSGCVYLIGEAGIEFACRKMTLADIERELGYPVEIVEK